MVDSSGFVAIVGAPRCGTTSLARFLGAHPEVRFSSVKEPHFFSRFDLRYHYGERLEEIVRDQYLARYFPDGAGDARMMAEGSVSYLYAAEQMKPIVRMWPNAKFVIALRDPLEMLPSLHRRLLCTGDESVRDFATAWALMPERARGRCIPKSRIDPRFLNYSEAGALGTYVERFFEAVGRDRCFVALYDDLLADPAGLYSDLLQFLDLPHDGRTSFPRHRAGSGVRLGWLQRLLMRPPVATRKFLAGDKFRQRVRRLDKPREPSAMVRTVFAARKRLLDWNRAPAPTIELMPELRQEICETLAGEIRHLSRLIRRDLSHWLDGQGAALAAPNEMAAIAAE